MTRLAYEYPPQGKTIEHHGVMFHEGPPLFDEVRPQAPMAVIPCSYTQSYKRNMGRLVKAIEYGLDSMAADALSCKAAHIWSLSVCVDIDKQWVRLEGVMMVQRRD